MNTARASRTSVAQVDNHPRQQPDCTPANSGSLITAAALLTVAARRVASAVRILGGVCSLNGTTASATTGRLVAFSIPTRTFTDGFVDCEDVMLCLHPRNSPVQQALYIPWVLDLLAVPHHCAASVVLVLEICRILLQEIIQSLGSSSRLGRHPHQLPSVLQ